MKYIFLMITLFSVMLFTSCSKNKTVQTYFIASHDADYDGSLVFVDDIKIISSEDANKITYISSPDNELNVEYGIMTLPDAEVIELTPGTYTVEYKTFNKNGYGMKLNEKTIHKQITIESGTTPMYSIIGDDFEKYDSEVADKKEATNFIQKKVDELKHVYDSLYQKEYEMEMNRLDSIDNIN